MRVGILRNQRDSLLISGRRLGQPLHLVEHIAEVEECERILGVRIGCSPVVFLGQLKPAQVVVDRPEVDQRRCVLRPDRREWSRRSPSPVGDGGRVFFKLYRAQKHLLHIGRLPRGSVSAAPTTLSCRAGEVSKSNASCWVSGSISAPPWRKLSRDPRRTKLASISGLRMPATRCIASTDARMLFAEMRAVACRSRSFRNWLNASKE